MPSYRFQWDEIQALSVPETNIVALTHVGALCILACSAFYDDRRKWFNSENPVSDAEWDDISKVLGQMEHEIMSGLVGAIIPHVMGDISGLTLLPCDGSIYLREDYPVLYEKIDPVYIIDPDTFSVPDMREMFPFGEGGSYSIDDTGGAAEHELTIDEIPAHDHSETIAVSTIINGGIEAPANAAIPATGLTGAAGGGQAHNNMPPFRVVRFAIVAG